MELQEGTPGLILGGLVGLGVLPGSYYASKALRLGVLSVSQSTLLSLLVNAGTGLPGSGLGQWLTLVWLSLCGMSLGLVISALAKTEDMAVTAVPIVLIPQVMFSGAVVGVEGFGKFVAQGFITLYWGNRALLGLLPDDLVAALGAEDWSVAGALTVIALHGLVFVAAAVGALLLQARRK